MHICVDCGGMRKMIAKPGRMTWEGEELYEIPQEVKIATCVECGTPFEDAYFKGRVSRAILAQKNANPGFRVNMLRYIDKTIRNAILRPGMYVGTSSAALETMILTLLGCRETVLNKGVEPGGNKLVEAYMKFLTKRFPGCGARGDMLHDLDLEAEAAPMLSEFCDVWINATV